MICFVLVTLYTSEVRKASQKLYTHTHTHTHTHFDRRMQYIQIQKLSMSSFSLNLLYIVLTTFLLTLPKIDSLHSPEFRNMCGSPRSQKWVR